MLAWLSLNMGLSHELIQNERGCLIYEASPRFVFGRLYGVESSSERVFCRCGTIIRLGIFEYSCGAFRIFARGLAGSRVLGVGLRTGVGRVAVGLRVQRYNIRKHQSYDSVRYVRLSTIEYDSRWWRHENMLFCRHKNRRTCFF